MRLSIVYLKAECPRLDKSIFSTLKLSHFDKQLLSIISYGWELYYSLII